MKSRLVALAAATSIAVGGGVALTATSFAAPTATTASVPVADTSAYPPLRHGDRGNDVKVLQRLLRANGATVAVDGSFGDATAAALKAFQASKGLHADAVAGPITWSKLVPVLERGARGENVKALQLTLMTNGANLKVDGSFGDATHGALVAFQKSKGLSPDGVAGPKTWGAFLNGERAKRNYVVMNQYKTGEFARENCGPTSSVMALVALGVKVDHYGGPTAYGDAVHHFRRDKDRMDNQWVGAGSSGEQIRKGLSSYGVPNRVTTTPEALAAVRDGKMVVSHGHSGLLPWLDGRFGHYILIAEYLGDDQYRVLDPAGGHDKVTSGATLSRFASKTEQPDGRTDRYYNQTVVG